MKIRQINLYERIGLCLALDEEFDSMRDLPIKESVCGTLENGMLNLEHLHTSEAPNEEFPYLSSIGLTEGDGVVVCLYNMGLSESKTYYGTHPDYKWREVIELNNNELKFI